jgi:hypothetical protein
MCRCWLSTAAAGRRQPGVKCCQCTAPASCSLCTTGVISEGSQQPPSETVTHLHRQPLSSLRLTSLIPPSSLSCLLLCCSLIQLTQVIIPPAGAQHMLEALGTDAVPVTVDVQPVTPHASIATCRNNSSSGNNSSGKSSSLWQCRRKNPRMYQTRYDHTRRCHRAEGWC